MSIPVPFRSKPLLFALGAGCVGFALNQFGMPVFGGTTLILGGVLTLLTAFNFGPALGGLAAAIAFSRTWLNWHHPAGFVCFTLEAIVVGWLVRRRRLHPIRATALYWLVCGIPLLLGFLGRYHDIPFPTNWAMLIAYPLNGLLMAALALPVSNSSRFRRWLGLPVPDDSGTPLQHVLFRRFGIIAALPLLVLILLMGQAFDRTLLASAESNLRDDTEQLARQIDQTFAGHQHDLQALARQLRVAETPPATLPVRLDLLLRQYPGFLLLRVTDAPGAVIAAASNEPEARAEAGTWFPAHVFSKRTGASRPAEVSPVYRGPGVGRDLLMAISVRVPFEDSRQPCILEGVVNLKPILENLKTDNRLHDRSLLALDRTGNVVLSTGQVHLPVLSSLREHPLQLDGTRDGDVLPVDWEQTAGTRTERYLGVGYQLPSCGWQITMLEPVWISQRTIAGFYAATAFWGLLAVGLALWLARATAGGITDSLKQIAATTQSLVSQDVGPPARPGLFPSREFAIINIDLHSAASALSRSNRQLAGAMAERDQSHGQLRQLLLNLDEKVRERTAQLEEARRAAESANTGKSEFLASMSHELRTPLNVILGMAEILREQLQGSLTERQLECVVAVEESGRHLLVLINDILDLSKIESGMMELEWQETGVRDVCEASLRLVREAAVRKSIRLGATYRQSAEVLSADSRRLKQILVNLLSNAVKFTPDGGTVTLVVDQLAAPDRLSFTVQDNGIGIDPRHLGKLFQPFQQIDSALNRKYAGTGLGLSLVKRMTQMHGGTVEIESESGQGARFTVTLPLLGCHTGPDTPARVERIPRSGAHAPVISGEPLILIAEDNPINVQIYTGYLSRFNCRFVFAKNGREAIDRVHADHPDLVLMDVQMPDMDGLEATRRLRADPRTVTLPILAVTALARPEDRIRCLEAGASNYLSKPVNLKELTGLIAELLVRKPTLAATSAAASGL